MMKHKPTPNHIDVPVITKEQKIDSLMQELSEIINGTWVSGIHSDSSYEKLVRESSRQDEICAAVTKLQMEK